MGKYVRDWDEVRGWPSAVRLFLFPMKGLWGTSTMFCVYAILACVIILPTGPVTRWSLPAIVAVQIFCAWMLYRQTKREWDDGTED